MNFKNTMTIKDNIDLFPIKKIIKNIFLFFIIKLIII